MEIEQYLRRLGSDELGSGDPPKLLPKGVPVKICPDAFGIFSRKSVFQFTKNYFQYQESTLII